MIVAGHSDKGLTLQYAPAGRTLPRAVIASRVRESCCPPPPDVLPPRPGGHPSPSTASAASRAVGFADGTAPDHGIMLRASVGG